VPVFARLWPVRVKVVKVGVSFTTWVVQSATLATAGLLVMVLPIANSQDNRTDFDAKYAKRRIPRNDVPFGGFANIVPRLRDQISPKLQIWG